MTKVASNPKVASQPTTYTLHLSEAQLGTISHACEVLARLGMGQFKDALECLPIVKGYSPGWHEDMDGISHILKKHTTVLHGMAYHSIGSAKTSRTSKTAWDLYQVTRHRLAWDRNPAGDSMSVLFDQPHKTGPEPLAWVEKVEMKGPMA